FQGIVVTPLLIALSQLPPDYLSGTQCDSPGPRCRPGYFDCRRFDAIDLNGVESHHAGAVGSEPTHSRGKLKPINLLVFGPGRFCLIFVLVRCHSPVDTSRQKRVRVEVMRFFIAGFLREYNRVTRLTVENNFSEALG